MSSFKMQLLSLAVGACALVTSAAVQAQTLSISPDGLRSGAQMAFSGCGHNYYRSPNGQCDIVRNPNQDCPNGFHSVPAPTRSGYRCVEDGY